MEGIDIKSSLLNNKTTIIRILFFCVIAIIIYITTRLKFTYDKIRQNWSVYQCKYPYSILGGYLAPDGIKDEDGKVHYGMRGSRINYEKCNKDLHSALIGGMLAPVYASYGNDLKKLKNQRNKMSILMRYTERIREIIGESFKRVFKFLLVIYYILIYIFQKVKLILFKVQGVIDVILDTFKIYLRFINYLLFTIIPLYLKWQVSMVSLSLSYTIFSLMSTAGGSVVSTGLLGQGLGYLLGASANPLLLPILLVLAAVSAAAIYVLFLWFMGSAKSFIQQNTQFSGIGNIPPLPLLEDWAYDREIDPIASASNEPMAKNQKNTAGSVMNILSIITIALEGELEHDTSTCLTEYSLVNLKNCVLSIKNCKPGDLLNNGGQINGMVIYKPKIVDIYEYKGVTMTGTHYVYDESGLLKACKDIGVLKGTFEEKLYCPITSNGKLNVVGSKKESLSIADYNDSKSFTDWNFETDIKLNKKENYEYSKYKEHNYPPLFADKDITKDIKNIGIVKHISTDDIKLYDYKGIIVSGNVLVQEQGTWLRVWQTNAIHEKNNYKMLYNVITDDHNMNINNMNFKDFEELDY